MPARLMNKAVLLASGEARYIAGVRSPVDRELSCEG